MHNEDNDYELLYLIGENDEDAYNELNNKYSRIIKNIAKRIYNNSKYYGFELDDVCQMGLYGFYKAVESFDEKQGVLFYTYAISVVTKEMMTFVRNYSRDKHNILSDSISMNKQINEDGDSVENFIANYDNTNDDFNNFEVSKRIIDVKYDLPFIHSLVFELRLNNFSNKEITILLDIGYKKLDNILRYIKDKFEKNLIEEN